MLKKIL
jgi:hypothetical protein